MMWRLSFRYPLTVSLALLLGSLLGITLFGANGEVFSQMQMNDKPMPNNSSQGMHTGQQMTGMGSGQMGDMGSGQMGGMGGMDMGQMPPHYSKSTYDVMSSVKGIEISGLDIVNDKEI